MGKIRDAIRDEEPDDKWGKVLTLDRRVLPIRKKGRLKDLAADPAVRAKLAEMRGDESSGQTGDGKASP